jgi:beta-glucosidase/6-phospho-beta-glucosidase/beta-galactosidase
MTPRFNSFFIGGFECTYSLQKDGNRLDLLRDSRHEEFCVEDYRMLRSLGATTVREGLSWSQVDLGNGMYDFSRFEKIMQVGQQEGVQQIWDLNHFDFPEHLDPFLSEFVSQFAEYAKRAVLALRKYQAGVLYIVPLNEMSFFAQVGGQEGGWAPFAINKGVQFKDQLVRANIAAMDAIWEVDNAVQFIQVDPIMHRHARQPISESEQVAVNHFNNEVQFESWDMLSGRKKPELGGDPKYLPIIGVNYYIQNQEYVSTSPETGEVQREIMPLNSPDRLSLRVILEEIYARYGCPMVITETGSVGDSRPAWWGGIGREIQEVIDSSLPLYGVCAYPIIDNLNTTFVAYRSGLYDFDPADASCARIPHKETIELIKPWLDEIHMRQHLVG